jgi:hypothetical protein
MLKTDYTILLAQLQRVDPNTGNIVTTTRNGGEIEASGLEIEAILLPTGGNGFAKSSVSWDTR